MPTAPPRLLLATRNAGKRRELTALLADLPVRLVGPDDIGPLPDVDETGQTFVANAHLKAQAYARSAGCLALADDSGLEVNALGGAPGVQSARYAGPDADAAANNARLLAALVDVPPARRTARFHCAMACVDPAGRVVATAEGQTTGRILAAPRGDRGFGYDPLFLSDDLGVSFGEAAPADKNRVSHRARACAALRAALVAALGSD